jgi:hypothetical protein
LPSRAVSAAFKEEVEARLLAGPEAAALKPALTSLVEVNIFANF